MEAKEEPAVTLPQTEQKTDDTDPVTQSEQNADVQLAHNNMPSTPSIQNPKPTLTLSRTPSKWIAQGIMYLRDIDRIKFLWPQLYQPGNEDVLSTVTTYYHLDYDGVSVNKLALLEKIHVVYENDYDALYYIVLCAMKLYHWRIEKILDVLKTSNNEYVCKKVKILFAQINDQCEDKRNCQEMSKAIQADHFMVLGELESLIAVSAYFNAHEQDMDDKEIAFIRMLVAAILPALNFESLLKMKNRFLRYLAKSFIAGFSQCDSKIKKLIFELFNKHSLPPNERFFSVLFRLENANLRGPLLIYASKIGHLQAEFLLEFFRLTVERYHCDRCININKNLLKDILEQYDAETVAKVINHIDSLKTMSENNTFDYMKGLFLIPKPVRQDDHINHYLEDLQKIVINAPLQWMIEIVISPLIKIIQKFGVAYTAAIVKVLVPLKREMYQRLNIFDSINRFGSDALSQFVSAMNHFDVAMQLLVDIKIVYLKDKDAWLVDKLLGHGFSEAAALLEMMPQFFVVKNPPESTIHDSSPNTNTVAVTKQLDWSSIHARNKSLYSEFAIHIRYTYQKYGLLGIRELKNVLEEIEQCELFHDSIACKKLLISLCAHMYINGFYGVLKAYGRFLNNYSVVRISKKNNSDECELQPFSDSLSSAQLVSQVGLYGRMQTNIILSSSELSVMKEKMQQALRFLSEQHYRELLKLIETYEEEVAEEYSSLVRNSSLQLELPYLTQVSPQKCAKLFFLQNLKKIVESNLDDALMDIIVILKKMTKREFPAEDIEQGLKSRCYSFIQKISQDPAAIAIPSRVH